MDGIAFSRVGNWTELGEDLDRASRENVDLSLFFGFLSRENGKMNEGWELGNGLMFPVPITEPMASIVVPIH